MGGHCSPPRNLLPHFPYYKVMSILKSISLLLIVCCTSISAFAGDGHKEYYHNTFAEQHQMLKGEIPVDFTRAVFLSENSYLNGKLNYAEFKKEIEETGNKLKEFIVDNEMSRYKTAGNWAVFEYITQELFINDYKPYSYDFEDYFGEEDLTKMFVTKLMKVKSGNCHSMPYFYKMLCDELGAESHLAITPNHVYIKHLNDRGQWTNVELTNASFPKDKWIIKDIDITKKAVANKVYMNPLTEKEGIALTVFDLATAYEMQFGVDSFYKSIVDTALVYYPNCIPLLMNKANYYSEVGIMEEKKEVPDLNVLKVMRQKQEFVDTQISELGHVEMSDEQYAEWIKFMEKEKAKEQKKEARKKKKQLKK